jgi:uncharacterized membrane protein
MMLRNLLVPKRSLRLPLEHPLLDSLKIYASRLLVTSLIYGICLGALLIFTGQNVEFKDEFILITVSSIIVVRLCESVARRKSKSADDEIDE